jgi:hypothetical protein
MIVARRRGKPAPLQRFSAGDVAIRVALIECLRGHLSGAIKESPACLHEHGTSATLGALPFAIAMKDDRPFTFFETDIRR